MSPTKWPKVELDGRGAGGLVRANGIVLGQV
jgi:hypothetical protein